MAEIKRGARFISIINFKEALKKIEVAQCVIFVVASSVKLIKSPNLSEEDVNKFVYKRVKYECKFCGTVRDRSNGIRASSSFRTGCVAFITVLYNK